jgi:glycosyltransferase involved in cell wall biosynthesis
MESAGSRGFTPILFMSSELKPLMQVCLSRAWGGLEMAAHELARDYTKRGHVVTSVVPHASRLAGILKNDSLPVIEVESQKYFSPSTSRAIRRAVRSTGAKTVLMHQLPDIWLVVPALLGLHVRLLGFAHMFLSHSKKDLLHSALYKRVEKIICLTRVQKKNFLEILPIKEEQIAIVPNGVDTRKFSPSNRSDIVRKGLGASEELLIGVIGRLDKLKGQLELVEAARILKQKDLKFKIAIVGEETANEGGIRSALVKKIEQNQLQNFVRLAGFRLEIPEIVASLDILIMPSWAETFGRVVIEAMASGTPVIATNAGGVPDIITDGSDGLLVPPQNPEAIAKAIETLLLNPQMRETFRINGLKKAREVYDIKLVQNQLDELILRDTNN